MSPQTAKRLTVKQPRPAKRYAGRTRLAETPLRLHMSGVELTREAEERKRVLLVRRLARFGTFIERADVRFKGIDSPRRGGEDVRCRINLAVSGRPSVFVEERARDAERAFSRAAASVSRAMARSVERKGLTAPPATRPLPKKSRAARRSRPEAITPEPSGSKDRPRRRGMVYVLEESNTRPSRKSTRKSANRKKGGSKLFRRTQRRKHSPKARASRAKSQRQRSRVGR
jgi:hypothetical protein